MVESDSHVSLKWTPEGLRKSLKKLSMAGRMPALTGRDVLAFYEAAEQIGKQGGTADFYICPCNEDRCFCFYLSLSYSLFFEERQNTLTKVVF